MGKPTGFMEYRRETPQKRNVEERLRDSREVSLPLAEDKLRAQGARCMDCGIPFCHTGCPLGNIIPDFNDLAYRGRWAEALRELESTNNFPEFTGRVCPAPCEESCVLGINDDPVTIEQMECAIVEKGFAEGWVTPRPPATRTGKTVAVVGSGPAGLAAAAQLNRAGHAVTVLERADRIGGLLTYGIPDFKLEKSVVERRVKIMEAEGITFRPNTNVGEDYPVEKLKSFDAVVLAGGATKPRDLPIPGRDLDGVFFAMQFLPQQNQRVAGDVIAEKEAILATDKHVIVIGGGDTGSDCIGTSNRQKPKSVTQFELLPEPPTGRPANQPWPYWPMKMRTSTSHEEGCDRVWSIMTKEFIGERGRVTTLRTVEVAWEPSSNGGQPRLEELPGTEREWPADLVLLAMGFVGPETNGMIAQLGLDLDERNNVRTDEDYMTSTPGIFSAGDMRRGQSLVVWAIAEGREAARSVDRYLMGHTTLPAKGEGDLSRI